jgi:hypothetical protein
VVNIRVLDLDGSLRQQALLLKHFKPLVHDFRWWGPRLRLGCSFARFERFQHALTAELGVPVPDEPALTFVGSGDFHHVTLALLRRIDRPFNLLVLDKHPDWMRGIPVMHCGTWLYHAARLPHVRRIIHIGGDVDFDNGFRWLAPWPWLRQGKIHVIPSVRRFQRGGWSELAFPALRENAATPADWRRIEALLMPLRDDLERVPLYISLDKDVLGARHAVVNWDSGFLNLNEVESIICGFIDAARGDVVGMDIVGDWSAVRIRGLGRRLLHWTEHPRLEITATHATQCNQSTNLRILKKLSGVLNVPGEMAPALAA